MREHHDTGTGLGFTVAIPALYFDGARHHFELFDEDGEAVRLPTLEQPPDWVQHFELAEHVLEGRLVTATVDGIVAGWVAMANRRTGSWRVRNEIEVSTSAGTIARFIAEVDRPDVALTLGCEPLCGFRFQATPEILAEAPTQLRFVVLPERIELPRSPIELPAPAPAAHTPVDDAPAIAEQMPQAAPASPSEPPPADLATGPDAPIEPAPEPAPPPAAPPPDASEDAAPPDLAPRVRQRRFVFTIVSANYISFAATLMRSVAEHVPDADRYIVLSDAMQAFPDIDLHAELLACDGLGIAAIANMKVWYTVIEFNTAVKPFAFQHLFSTLGYQEGCYIDPDILLYSDLHEVFDALADHSCVLTPHISKPMRDGKEPSEHTIMKSGVYNLGFLGLRNDDDALALLDWWAERLFLECRVDIAGNMFTDQRWMDLAPVLVRRPFILRHSGYNVAYWNLSHRTVEKTPEGNWLVNGERLVFFHFSGVSPIDPDEFSKHQNRFGRDNLGIVNELCDDYRALVLANRWEDYSKVPYAFGTFRDGARIETPMRRWVLRMIDQGHLDPKGRLQFTAGFFDRPDEIAAASGAVLTRYMYQLWLDRKDLRDAFDVYQEGGLADYYNWFLGSDALLQGATLRTLAAAERLRSHGARPMASVEPMRAPPWPAVADEAPEAPDTPSGTAFAHFASDLRYDILGSSALLPRQFALLWERRRDLQQAFDVTLPDRFQAFITWCFTNGIAENCVDPDHLSPATLESFTQVSKMSLHYGDVRFTEGMILVRNVNLAREFLPGWQRFPVERAGRYAQGLWFAFIAPNLFHWPQTFSAPTRRYFQELGTVLVDGYVLNRGSLALWELRTDLQQTFPLTDRLSVWRYLRWMLIDGLRELEIAATVFDPRLRDFLLSESPRIPGISQVLEMLHDFRADLKEEFDLSADEGRAALRDWAELHLSAATRNMPLGDVLTAGVVAAAEPAYCAQVGLTGYWTAPSGRGEDLRGSAEALRAAGFTDFVVIDFETRAILLPDGTALPAGTTVELGVNVLHTNADTGFEDALILKRLGVRSARNIGFWAWELEWLPDYWRHSFLFYDEVWAATRFAQAAFSRPGLRPVTLVPMAVLEPVIEARMSRAELGLPEGDTVFLFMFDFRSFASRKNPEATVRAFLMAFPQGDERAYLLIKTSGAEARPDDFDRLRELANDARIEIRDVRLERGELLNLMQQTDAFVSLHRSEGFGRGPAESMLLGVPVIVTDYSGTADYATPDCALVVDYDLIAVDKDEYPGVTGQSWADANVTTAARHMRWVHENPAKARELGARGRERIRQLYGTKTVGDGMLRALGLAAKAPPVSPRSTRRLPQGAPRTPSAPRQTRHP